MSVYAKTGEPSRPGPYFITACKDGTSAPFYVCDTHEFNVLGLLFMDIRSAEKELRKVQFTTPKTPKGETE